MGNYRDLDAWKASKALAVATYRVTDRFPSAERFGLTAQVRRAAVSVMSNLAEAPDAARMRNSPHFCE